MLLFTFQLQITYYCSCYKFTLEMFYTNTVSHRATCWNVQKMGTWYQHTQLFIPETYIENVGRHTHTHTHNYFLTYEYRIICCFKVKCAWICFLPTKGGLSDIMIDYSATIRNKHTQCVYIQVTSDGLVTHFFRYVFISGISVFI